MGYEVDPIQALIAAAGWFSAFVAVALGVITIFKNKIEAWQLDLNLDTHPHEPYIQRQNPVDYKYRIRLAVLNNSSISAEQASVWIDSLSKQVPSGEFKPVVGFIPIPLSWTHENVHTLDFVSPSQRRFVDLGIYFLNEPGSADDSMFLRITTPFPPATGAATLDGGVYRAGIGVYSKQGLAGRWSIQIQMRGTMGNWLGDQLPEPGIVITKID